MQECRTCCCSVTNSCLTLCDSVNCSTPGFPILHYLLSLLKLMSIELVMPSNHLVLCHPLFLLPSIFPSIRVSSNESALCIQWPKYWNFSFTTSPSKENLGFISFRIDWFDLLAVQGTLKSLLQHHSWKASILRCSAFFMIQLPHPLFWLNIRAPFQAEGYRSVSSFFFFFWHVGSSPTKDRTHAACNESEES